MTATHSTDVPLSLDGLEFVMTSSTASRVDPDAPTRFSYQQQGSLVWGDYTGDTVTVGRFVGQIAGATLTISFGHELVADRSVVTGSATSAIERREDGLIYLIEEFEKDGAQHVSVCVQAV